MKPTLLFCFLTVMSFVACSPTGEQKNETPFDETVNMTLTTAMRQLVPYQKDHVAVFSLQNQQELSYVTGARKLKQLTVYQNNESGGTRTTNYEVEEIAIIPDNDLEKCMMMTLDAQAKTLELLIEDSQALKWNYFYLAFKDDGTLDLKSPLASKPQEIGNLTLNGKTFTNVVQLTNTRNDHVWYSPQSGVVKANLADGRTWEKR
jgi:hypothetical protein